MIQAYLDATIVDVRSPGEYDCKHVAGAINIPLDEISSRLNEFKTLSKPIVAYCKSGTRSGMAVSKLQQNGITEVVNGGGIDDMLQTTK